MKSGSTSTSALRHSLRLSCALVVLATMGLGSREGECQSDAPVPTAIAPDEAAWSQATRLEVPPDPADFATELALLERDGVLWVRVSTARPYQREHGLIVYLARAGASQGVMLSYRPWSLDVARLLVAATGVPDRPPGAPGAALDATPAPATGVFDQVAFRDGAHWASGWTAVLGIALPELAGATEVAIAFELFNEAGVRRQPAELHPMHPDTWLTRRLAAPIAIPSSSAEAFAARAIANRRYAALIEELLRLNQIRDTGGMLRTSQKLEAEDPRSPMARMSVATMLGADGRLGESFAILETLRREMPGLAGLPSAEAEAHAYLQEQRWEEARARLLALPEDNLRRRIDLGMLDYHLGNFAAARDQLTAVHDEPALAADSSRKELVGAFRDHAAEYASVTEAAEAKFRERDAAGEPLPQVALIFATGKVVCELYENDAPNTVACFLALAEEGFYVGTRIHLHVACAQVQLGCPLTTNDIERDDGLGGPGYYIPSEPNPRRHFRGVLGMANQGSPNTEGSQFYITTGTAAHLNGKSLVFGRVLEGQDIVDRLGVGDRLERIEILRRRDHPYTCTKITR